MPVARRTVVCMKWGHKYSAEYVNVLSRMVRRHCGIEYRFVCITDDSRSMNKPTYRVRSTRRLVSVGGRRRGAEVTRSTVLRLRRGNCFRCRHYLPTAASWSFMANPIRPRLREVGFIERKNDFDYRRPHDQRLGFWIIGDSKQRYFASFLFRPKTNPRSFDRGFWNKALAVTYSCMA